MTSLMSMVMMKKWMKNFEKNFTLVTVGVADVVVVTFVGWFRVPGGFMKQSMMLVMILEKKIHLGQKQY